MNQVMKFSGDAPKETARGFMAAPLLVQYWAVAKRWKWAIAATIAGALILGLLVTLLMTPQFTAEARVKIDREEKQITNVEGLEPSSAGQDEEFYQTQYALLETDMLAQRVARKLRLSTSPEFFAAHGKNLDGSPLGNLAPSSTDREAREHEVVTMLLDHVSITPVRGSALVDVAYTSGDAVWSARIANAWVSEFIGSSIDSRFASTADARKFLEDRLAELRARLEHSEREAVDYATRQGIVSLGATQDAQGRTTSQRTLAVADLEALNTALAEATSARIQAQSRAGSQALSDVNANPTIAQLRQARAEASAEYARLMVQFEPGYPAARSLREKIDALDSSIAREESRVRAARGNEYAEAISRENQLRSQVAALRGQLDRQQRDSIQYNIYQREADTNRQLYDALLQRYKEIGVAGVGLNNISIVDPAEVPRTQSSPNLLLNLFFALFGGLLAAGALTVALDQIDEGLRDPGDVGTKLNLPLLGGIPEVAGDRDGDALDELGDPKSELSEAYMSVRSTLSFATDHGLPKSIMFTSTRPAEGKSTSAVAFATVLARSGKSVALIDADMRAPSIHSVFGMENAQGLSNWLSGDNDWLALLRNSPLASLSVMTSGPTPPSAAELLSSVRAAQLIPQLLNQFDHIIIDSPPMLGLADALLISRLVEGVVFVVEAEGAPVRSIDAAIERLRTVNANILGIILTRLKRREAGYGYGYEYGYGKKAEA